MSAVVESKLSRNEGLKSADPLLAGAIAATLQDASAERFSDDDYEFLKFHGIYQQDDRDLRKTGKKWIFMVRGRLPGGLVSSQQYLAFDELASKYGNDSLRITSRQGFQFHGVVKAGLRPLVRGIHEALSTTLAACGDVCRNVMAPPTPATGRLGAEVLADAQAVNAALLPRTRAYHEIWVEGQELKQETASAEADVDPLYGRTYLPRKFKVAFAVPPLNDTDVFTNCLGFVAIERSGSLVGYNLLAGGGMGMSHGNAQTYPRVADVVGFVPRERLVEAARAVLTVFRDFGDRTNRKHARLKYVLEEKGVAWFRRELESRLGFALGEPLPFHFDQQGDLFGWHQQHDQRWFLGVYVEAGRIADRGSLRVKSALREVVARFQPEIRLTPSQNLLLVNVPGEQREEVDRILAGHGIQSGAQTSLVRRSSMACPALPTCGLALAESERFLPTLLDRVEGLMRAVGLGEDSLVVRMTGCPNGCVRTYMAELGLVGRAPGRYQILLGGDPGSTRLNRAYRDNVKEAEIEAELRPLFERYASTRQAGERFGDWCARSIWTASAS